MPLASDPGPSSAFQAGPHLQCSPTPLLPSLVQAGTAGWAQLAPISAPPLVPLMLPDGAGWKGS